MITPAPEKRVGEAVRPPAGPQTERWSRPGRRPADGRPSGLRYVRPAAVLAVLAAGLFAAVVLATAVGVVALPYGETARIVFAKLLGLSSGAAPASEAIIWGVRMPRVAAAGLVGLALATSGAAMQALFKNPLASPDLIGVSTGGAVGAVAAIFLGWSLVSPWLMPAAAFAGALAAAALVYALGTRAGRTDIATLLLAGVAVSAFGGALISLLYHFVDDGVLRQIVYWLMGNLGGKRWEHVLAMAPFVGVGAMGLVLFSSELNMLMGGEDDAKAMGVAVERTKRWVLVLVALSTGAAVSVAGIIGFVGLIVPHILRLVIGPDHRWLLPASGLAGAAFLILADLAARTVFSPVELRTGIVTALCGAPFFLHLLMKRRELVRWS